MSKKIKHVIFTFALAVVVAFSAALSACTTIKTKHPRAQITVEFNDETYKIEYTLYRNMYPQTVQHFIELADAGYYSNMIVHNYTGTEWYTGGYSYEAQDEHFAYTTAYPKSMTDYLNEYSKEQQYYDLAADGTLTPTVYKQIAYDNKGNEVVRAEDALPTLIGEFTKNDHNIKNGALTADFGVLKMYYYNKGDTYQKVAIKNSFDQILEHDYKYNAATSIFTIQTSQSSGHTGSEYAIFARLRNDKQVDKLNDLLDAISDYQDGLSTTNDNFTTSVSTEVDKLDKFAEDDGRNITTSFTMTSLPIIIRSVKITKY